MNQKKIIKIDTINDILINTIKTKWFPSYKLLQIIFYNNIYIIYYFIRKLIQIKNNYNLCSVKLKRNEFIEILVYNKIKQLTKFNSKKKIFI